MAQTGFTPIQLYFSSTTTNVPLAANLASGELAINITDGKLFYKDNANAVQVIGWKVVPATAGGTGQTSYAVGDLLYANTTTTLAKLPDVATGNALISGGVSTAPSWGKIVLTTHVSGVLPVANGGTNASAASITAFNNITGYSASGATGTTSTNLVFSTSPSITTPTLVGDATLSTGNLIQGTAAKGVNFTANTPAAGMTSQLLNWYEQGSFTPVLTCATPGTLAVTYATQTAKYQRVGNVCHVWINIQTDSVTYGTASGAVRITGFPFTSSLNGVESSMGSMMFQGITKVGYTQFSPQAIWTTTYMQIVASGTGLAASNLAIGEISTGTNVLNIYVAYIVA